MNNLPPYWDSAIFNSAAFQSVGYLTRQEADRLYLSVSAGANLGLIAGITPGMASAGKALIIDSSFNLSGVNNFGITGVFTSSGNGQNVNITGIGSKLQLTGVGSGINLTNSISSIVLMSTLSNSISTLGGITASGSISALNLIIGSTTISESEIAVLDGVTAGTASASKALVVDASKNIASLGTIGQTIASGGDMITLTSSNTGARNTIKFVTDLQSWEVGSRASTASNPNTLYMYNGGYKFLMQPSGDTSILSSTASTSKTTGALQVTGGISTQGSMWNNQTNISASGSHLSLFNGANSALIELDATPNLRLVRGFAMNLGSSGLNLGSASTITPRYPLDFGATAADVIINLFQSIGTSNALYGIGANNSAVEYHSGADHAWYKNTTANGSLGTKLMQLSASGLLDCVGTIRSTGISSPGSGAGIELSYDPSGSKSNIYSFDRSGGSYLDINLNDKCYLKGSNGYLGVATGSNVLFPLQVMGTANATRLTGTYGWLSAAGSGSSTSFTNRPFSIYSDGGILVNSGEVDSFSDIRMKTDIAELDSDIASRFMKATPIQYRYKNDPNSQQHLGYSAQSLMALGLHHLVGFTFADEPLEPMQVECIDGTTIDLPSDKRLVLSQLNIIPILHSLIKRQQEAIDELKARLDEVTSLKSKKPRKIKSIIL